MLQYLSVSIPFPFQGQHTSTDSTCRSFVPSSLRFVREAALLVDTRKQVIMAPYICVIYLVKWAIVKAKGVFPTDHFTKSFRTS